MNKTAKWPYVQTMFAQETLKVNFSTFMVLQILQSLKTESGTKTKKEKEGVEDSNRQ